MGIARATLSIRRGSPQQTNSLTRAFSSSPGTEDKEQRSGVPGYELGLQDAAMLAAWRIILFSVRPGVHEVRLHTLTLCGARRVEGSKAESVIVERNRRSKV